MNVLAFPKDVWLLHRKLHHRFLKFKKRFIAATEDLADYQRREGMIFAGSDSANEPTKKKSVAAEQIICLLSDSDTADEDEADVHVPAAMAEEAGTETEVEPEAEAAT